ncbi:MAG: pyridoxamine 5'-phosphate oxidase family protein [Gaiellales bacterium]
MSRRLSDAELRAAVGEPSRTVREKQLDHLDRHARAFIAASPLAIVSTASADGRCDASPRGDPAGFAQVIDDRTLLLPERKGNRRVDTLLNLTSNPHVGILFIVPGTNETVRVNGRASVTDDAELLSGCTVEGKTPQLGILVEVEEVFFHCARAFLRGRVWYHDEWLERSALPSLGRVLADQIAGIGDAETIDADLEESNRSLY